MRRLCALVLVAASSLAGQEMLELYQADQADRRVPFSALTPEAIKALMARDHARLKRTYELLRAGAVSSGLEFEQAAVLLQHGPDSEDYLQAHLAALAAQIRGRREARWITAASLDRFLRSIGQPQVFGTQEGADAAMDNAVLNDAFRVENCVPKLRDRGKHDARVYPCASEKQFHGAMKSIKPGSLDALHRTAIEGMDSAQAVDRLRAHVSAMTILARRNPDGRELVMKTLDRFLAAMKQPSAFSDGKLAASFRAVFF